MFLTNDDNIKKLADDISNIIISKGEYRRYVELKSILSSNTNSYNKVEAYKDAKAKSINNISDRTMLQNMYSEIMLDAIAYEYLELENSISKDVIGIFDLICSKLDI